MELGISIRSRKKELNMNRRRRSMSLVCFVIHEFGKQRVKGERTDR
jgi:hypothetical protein